jgi:hypothetical protein
MPLAALEVVEQRQFTAREYAPPPQRAAGTRVKDVTELVTMLKSRGVLA